MGEIKDDSWGGDWIGRTKTTILWGTLAEAGYEFARLVNYAQKTQHDEQFALDVSSCIKLFWERCAREKAREKGESSE